jgi:hypothetical protein
MACNVPEDAEYTYTLQAQMVQEPTGGARKRMGKEKGDRVVSLRPLKTVINWMTPRSPAPNHPTDEGD